MLQVLALLLVALTGMLDGLLETGDIGTDAVILALHGIELIAGLHMGLALALDAGLGAALAGHLRFEGRLLLVDLVFLLLCIAIERTPAQCLQLPLERTLLLLELLVALGGGGLTLQVVDLLFQLLAQVIQAIQVVAGVADAGLGLAAAFLVLGNPGCLFQEHAQLFRPGLDNA